MTENQKVRAFIEEVVSVCRKHGMSISHEDDQGAFIIVDLDESVIEWLQYAFDKTAATKKSHAESHATGK